MEPVSDVELRVGEHRHPALVAGPEGGRLVLLLHGFPQHAGTWRSQLTALAARGLLAVAPTQRGYSSGARPRDTGAYELDHLVADVTAFADELGHARFSLVGHDWGGIVAWHAAAAHPDRVESLAVVSMPHPAAYLDSLRRSTQLARSSYVALFRARGIAEGVLGVRDNAGLRFFLERSGLDASWACDYAAALSGPGALTAALNWYRAASPQALACPPVEVPTLFVWGAHDPALGRAAALATRDHVRGPYSFVPLDDAGHWIPEQEPDRLADLLVPFLLCSDSCL